MTTGDHDQQRSVSRRPRMILIGILVVALLSVGGVLNWWRNGGLWGVSDVMLQMRHDPMGDKHLLGFTRCGVSEDTGALAGGSPLRRSWYNPGPGDHREIIERAGRYAVAHGWTHTGWNENGYWMAERRQHLHRGMIGMSIGFDDPTPYPATSNDCWLKIAMAETN